MRHGLGLQIIEGFDEGDGILLGRHVRKVGVEPPLRKLGGIPGFMKNIQGKEPELCDDGVDRAV